MRQSDQQNMDDDTEAPPAVERGIGGGVAGLAVETQDDSDKNLMERLSDAELNPMSVSDILLVAVPIGLFIAIQALGYPTIGVFVMITALLGIAFWIGRPE